MAKTLTDWSQLDKIKIRPASPTTPAEKPKPETTQNIEALNFFNRPTAVKPQAIETQTTEPETETVKSANPVQSANGESTDALKAELREMRAKLSKITTERDKLQQEKDLAEMIAKGNKRQIEKLEKEISQQQHENERIKNDNTRLNKEYEKLKEKLQEIIGNLDSGVEIGSLLTMPDNFEEVFEGELRELILAIMQDALSVASRGEQDRRKRALAAVLAKNRSSGELQQRQRQLERIFRNANGAYEPNEFEKLGFKLISGSKHWKLDYAGIRLTIAKTPSDYRANQNNIVNFSKKCF